MSSATSSCDMEELVATRKSVICVNNGTPRLAVETRDDLDVAGLRPVHTHKGSGSSVDFRPRPCPGTYRWARLATHRHGGPRSVSIPYSHAHFGRFTTACVSSPRDWAVSIGSHMQQDMGVSIAPPHLVAPIPLFEHRSRLKTTILQKNWR